MTGAVVPRLASADQVVARIPSASVRSAGAVLAALGRALSYRRAGALDDALVSFNKDLVDFRPMEELLSWFDPRAVNATLGDDEFLVLVLQEFGLLAEVGPSWSAGDRPDVLPDGFDGEDAMALILATVKRRRDAGA